MSPTREGINFSEMRIKMFGPTLDDSVLYGVDRLLDCFAAAPDEENESRQESFYKSCESLSHETSDSLPAEFGVSKPPIVPKLSHQEMEYIRRAITQTRRQNHGRIAEAEPVSGMKLLRSRWAVTRINEFDDGSSTYEIMKSATDEKQLPAAAKPDSTEVVFAMFKNGNTGAYRVGYQRSRS